MPEVRVERDGEIAIIRMEMGKANAISAALLASLEKALDDVGRSDARGVVLTGQETYFSAGLDLVGLFDLDRTQMAAFLEVFDRVFLKVFDLPKPVVAAINGHAVAGGCILALACDVRIIADGHSKFGMPEIEIGLPFPTVALEIIRAAIPKSQVLPLLAGGVNYTPERAHALGLVHQVVPAPALLSEGLEHCRTFAKKDRAAFAEIKAGLHAEVQRRIEARRSTGNSRFLDCWFGESSRRLRSEVRDRLTKSR